MSCTQHVLLSNPNFNQITYRKLVRTSVEIPEPSLVLEHLVKCSSNASPPFAHFNIRRGDETKRRPDCLHMCCQYIHTEQSLNKEITSNYMKVP